MKDKITNLIRHVAQREDAEWQKIAGWGIIDIVVEHAFVYLFVKELKLLSQSIFSTPIDPNPVVEIKIQKTDKKQGIYRLDLYIEGAHDIIAIEFKLGNDTEYTWGKDIDKLLKIVPPSSKNLHRIFYLITNANTDKLDKFTQQQGKKIKRIGNLDRFDSLLAGNKKDCVLGFWEVIV